MAHQSANVEVATISSVSPSTTSDQAAAKPESQPKPPVERKGYRIKDYCEAYNVSRWTVWREIKAGRLRYIQFGRRIIIPIGAEPTPPPKPYMPRPKDCAPRLEVIITTAFEKSATRPIASVKRPSPST